MSTGVTVHVPAEGVEFERRSRRGWPSRVAYVVLLTAIGASVAEGGAFYRTAFHPRVPDGDTVITYVYFVDATGREIPMPSWWAAFLIGAIIGTVVLMPLLIAPVFALGWAVGRLLRGRPLALAYPIAAASGALLGAGVSYLMLLWGSGGRGEPGFAGCVAGGACGVLAAVGGARRRGMSAFLTETTLAGLIALAAGLFLTYGP